MKSSAATGFAFASVLVSSISAIPSTLNKRAGTSVLTFDYNYDNGDLTTNNVGCSQSSFMSQYAKLSDIPGYPNVGGGSPVSGYGSAQCGTCWKLDYTDDLSNINSIYVTLIDTAFGFNIAKPAFDQLTNGQSSGPGRVQVAYSPADSQSRCM